VSRLAAALAHPGPAEVHRWLLAGAAAGVDPFDGHVVASVLSLAVCDAQRERRPLGACVGLGGADLAALVERCFPHARRLLQRFDSPQRPPMTHLEASLRELLEGQSTAGTQLQQELAAIIARRSQRQNHLWQDLGLRSRLELSQLMTRHFAPLARRNHSDMKWKKFFSRLLCSDGTVAVCTAPSCGECDDRDSCFGEERGETLLTA
jgi:nitrogen fixation protein NifQ